MPAAPVGRVGLDFIKVRLVILGVLGGMGCYGVNLLCDISV